MTILKQKLMFKRLFHTNMLIQSSLFDFYLSNFVSQKIKSDEGSRIKILTVLAHQLIKNLIRIKIRHYASILKDFINLEFLCNTNSLLKLPIKFLLLLVLRIRI